MTNKFDAFCESLINEFQTAKSKRAESRYWKVTAYPKSMTPRSVQTARNITPSQKTKQGYQQYVGNPNTVNGVRGQNKSEKPHAEVGIAKGLGNHLRRVGVNPKKPGSAVHSKQGNMVVKYNLANGVMKVGSSGKTDFQETERNFHDDFHKKYD